MSYYLIDLKEKQEVLNLSQMQNTELIRRIQNIGYETTKLV